jgi:hypothetical protein
VGIGKTGKITHNLKSNLYQEELRICECKVIKNAGTERRTLPKMCFTKQANYFDVRI